MKGKKKLWAKAFATLAVVSALETLSYITTPLPGVENTYLVDLFFVVAGANLRLMAGFLIAPVFCRFFAMKRPIRKPIWIALLFIVSGAVTSLAFINQTNEPLYIGWVTTILFFYVHMEIMMYEKVEKSAEESPRQ